MIRFINCEILSAFILILLVSTLVIKEHDNRKISLFIPSVVLALISTAVSVYKNAVLPIEVKNGGDITLADVEPVITLIVYLSEAVSLSLFCLFLKNVLYKGSKRSGKTVSVLSFICIPLILAAAFLPYENIGYPIALLVQALLIILFVMFSCTERNVRAWFIAAALIFSAGCMISIFKGDIRLDGIAMMLMYLTVFIGYEVQLKNDLLNRKLELSKAKTALLMRQISPHFIFNSLQVIIQLCDSEREKVKPALVHFSEYLRGNLESIIHDELIPFTKELAHTKEYLALEQYGDGKEFTVKYDLGITDFKLPPLVLQPIVENAVRYGIGTKALGSQIVIETSDTPFMILVRVKDDGTGKSSITKQQSSRRSVGISNIRARLKAQCGGELIYENSESGTTVTITLPKSEM